MVAALCPDAHTLGQLAAGTLADEDSAPLEEHVLVCGRCAESVGRQMLADPLIAVARAARHAPPPPSAVRELAERIRQLADPPGTHTAAATPLAPGHRPVSNTHFSFLNPPASPDEIGRLGEYRLLSVLGEGGMGTVFLADEPKANRKVAIKTLLPTLAADPAARARFVREAQTLANLEHEHVVPVYHVGEQQAVPWLVMPLLKGESLADRLKREKVLPATEAVRVAREAALGLSAVHAAGLVHRDIKPGNLWVDERTGRVRVLDFGLARPTDGGNELTQTGAMVGTPAYMAPEQFTGTVDARADVWSLGVTLYRMLTGVMPFRGDTTGAIMASVLTDEPAAPSAVNAAVPAWLSALVMRMLAKDPASRPATMMGVADELATGGVGDELVRHAPATRHGTRPRRRWSESVVMSALALVTIAAVAVPAIVVIYDNDGKPFASVTVPKGGSVVVVPDDTKPAAPSPTKWAYPNGPPPLKAPFTAEEAAESQKKWAVFMKCAVESEVDLGKGKSMTFVLIPPGTFTMGEERLTHEESIPRPFWLGKTEVTQEQWLALNDKNPSEHRPDSPLPGGAVVAGRDTSRFPVTDVIWSEALDFAKAVGKKSGRVGTLPSVTQWEYACRAGTETPYHVGKTLTKEQANVSLRWPPEEDPGRGPKPAGSYPKWTNNFGLLDMHGNVAEWCADAEGPADRTPTRDGPVRRLPVESKERPICGGNWGGPFYLARSAGARAYPADGFTSAVGLRVCLVVD